MITLSFTDPGNSLLTYDVTEAAHRFFADADLDPDLRAEVERIGPAADRRARDQAEARGEKIHEDAIWHHVSTGLESLARSRGYDASAHDLEQYLKASLFARSGMGEGELSDEELDLISGGFMEYAPPCPACYCCLAPPYTCCISCSCDPPFPC